MPADEAFVLNADAAIRLDRLGYLQQLGRSAQVLITPSVAGRVLNEQPSVADLRWIRIVSPTSEQLHQVMDAARPDLSEIHTIALASQLGATAVIDSDASTYAKRAGVPVTNTVSVLTGIHGMGLAQRSIEEDLDLLEATGARLDGWTKELTVETVQSLAVLHYADGGPGFEL